MTDVLVARALARGGVLSMADIKHAGLRSRDIIRLVDDGTVIRVAPRAYVLGTSMAEAATPEERHKLSAMARVLSFGDRVAASHHSALALHGLPFWRVPDDEFHVARTTGRSSRRRGDLLLHESYPSECGDLTVLIRSPATGITAVSVALAVIGTAMVDGEEAGVVAADAALHRELMTAQECSAWLEALTRRPGLATARRVLELAEPLTESVGESRTRLLLHAMPGLPAVTPQHPFVDDAGHEWARADFLVGERLVVEFDGRTKYRAAEGSNTAEVEDIVWREKRREDRIRQDGGGKVVVRLIWADLDNGGRARPMVRAGLRQVEDLPRTA
ncbi:type IV toxin-antitoxin system AbiEi family antitoxin domain-containing protein [Pedococcus bigeumensis]|uniref:Transcriptional regulator, AbiEi antitoxin, Type IV TA system n=1 Tax=Pedococcus bigeumensis TaxID=433644 RepID=A0A502CS32_9MICO|nr:type IV toxin-antitoxin system AbiEi family antitoxin domain-containing protein [Pedococcus bigeumensis]TPG16037.1 hypothetical protein EAH86_12420 [Pedococcus bigeumensis]